MSDLDYSLYYREWHNDSDAHLEKMATSLLGQFERYLPADRSGRVLDIGCGMGFAIAAMQKAGFASVEGIDVDTSQVLACQKRGMRVTQSGDAEAYLLTTPGRFDLILLLDVLEHIPVSSQVDVLTAIYRGLAPGGRLIVQVPNANSILAARWLYQDFTHHSSFTERSIRFALLNAGFPKVNVPITESDPPRPSMLGALLPRNRWALKRWLIRKLWRTALEVELGEDVSKVPLSLNLLAIADKPAETRRAESAQPAEVMSV